MARVLEVLPAKEFKMASENPGKFIDFLQKKTSGDTAKRWYIAQMKFYLERLLPKGIPWTDIPEVLDAVETTKELRDWIQGGADLLMWKLLNVPAWPATKVYFWPSLRPKLEEKVPKGAVWEDFLYVLRALKPGEELD